MTTAVAWAPGLAVAAARSPRLPPAPIRYPPPIQGMQRPSNASRCSANLKRHRNHRLNVSGRTRFQVLCALGGAIPPFNKGIGAAFHLMLGGHRRMTTRTIRIFIEAAVAKIRGVFPYTACQSTTVAHYPRRPNAPPTVRGSRVPCGRNARRNGTLNSACFGPFGGWQPYPGTRGAPIGGVFGAKGGVFLPGSDHFPGAFKVVRPWLSQIR